MPAPTNPSGLSGALCSGLIEAVQLWHDLLGLHRYLELYAPASLKHGSPAPDLDRRHGYLELYAPASLKRRRTNHRLFLLACYLELYAPASLKRRDEIGGVVGRRRYLELYAPASLKQGAIPPVFAIRRGVIWSFMLRPH